MPQLRPQFIELPIAIFDEAGEYQGDYVNMLIGRAHVALIQPSIKDSKLSVVTLSVGAERHELIVVRHYEALRIDLG